MKVNALVLPAATILVFAGCAPDAAVEEDSGDIGETEDAIRTQDCTLSREKILSSVKGARRRAIERGFTWLDGDGSGEVQYSQSRSYKGYRTDCSGFVSMCWELDRSYTTADFIRGGGKSTLLSSYDDLVPADALVRRQGDSGHVVLFLGWTDKSRSAACVLEQNSTKYDMQFRARSAASLKSDGYKAIRADKLASEPALEEGTEDHTTCLSPTLDRDVADLTCVESQRGIWHQCKGGRWYRGVTGDDGPHGPCAATIDYPF